MGGQVQCCWGGSAVPPSEGSLSPKSFEPPAPLSQVPNGFQGGPSSQGWVPGRPSASGAHYPSRSLCLLPERLAPVWLQPWGCSKEEILCSLFCNLNLVAVGPASSAQTALLTLGSCPRLRMWDARGGGKAPDSFPWHLFRAWLHQFPDRHPPVS